MAKTTEIRVPITNDADAKTASEFMILSVIHGKSYDSTLFGAMRDYIKKHGKPLTRGTWLSQTETVEFLKEHHGITTNPQTLMNYRNAGRLDGAFCSDGQKKVFYLVEEVAKIFQQPTQRRSPEKTPLAEKR